MSSVSGVSTVKTGRGTIPARGAPHWWCLMMSSPVSFSSPETSCERLRFMRPVRWRGLRE